MKKVSANGLQLAYEEWGSGEPLILLHGINSDRRQYRIFAPHFADGMRVIAYDQRDSPDSPCPPEAYTMDDHAADLVGLIEGLGYERAHVMGASYGGAVAMNAALLYPEFIKSLTLGATAPSRGQFTAPDHRAVRAQGAEAVERYTLETAITPQAIDNDPQLVAELRSLVTPRAPESIARRANAMASHDVRDRLRSLEVPTLVLVGDSDPIISVETARGMAEAIPGARFELLAGSRHGITVEFRQRTADLVSAHVLAHA